jgi:hypothetical protein
MSTGPGMIPITPINWTPEKIQIVIRPEYRDAGNKNYTDKSSGC